MTRLAPGTTFSHYRIIEQLGEGGQATAYKAEDLRLKRIVVIKTLLPELAATESARRRFEREARLCSALDHPNIATIYDIGESDGLFYIVMQFVEGQTLKQFMSSQPLEQLGALSIAIQICDAIEVAHARGIAHRDIKPSNIVVNDRGQAKVLDFGLAKLFSRESTEVEPGARQLTLDKTMTEIGVPYGSMGYGSPEQATGERVDHRTDIFSLGVVLYEMLTGQQPFKGRHRIEVLSAVVNRSPKPVTEANPKVSPEFQPLLDRALAKLPADRYTTMSEMGADMKSLLRRLSQAAGIMTNPTVGLIAPQRQRNSWQLTGTLGRVFGRLRSSPSHAPNRAKSRPEAFGAASSRASDDGSSHSASASTSRPPSWGKETKQTMAVMPFRNLSGDPEADFYELSLADGIITELAHLRSLVVRPSNYVARYVGLNVDPRQVGDELAANLVLTGSFIKAPDRMRVTAQLIETVTGEIKWSEKIDIAARDLISIQDTIAERVIEGMKLKLTEEEQEKLDRPMTGSTEAYEAFLRGRDLLFQYISRTFDDRELGLAIDKFKEAISIDPKFGRAHAALGRCYVHQAQGYGGEEYYDLAEESLQRAIELDPEMAGPRLQMVYVYLHRGQKDLALAALAEARREAPNDPTTFIIAAMLYRLNGMYDKALRQYDRLVELNPRDAVIAGYNRARIYSYRHDHAAAIAELKKVGAIEPDHPLIKVFLAIAYYNENRIEDAQSLIEDVLAQHPNFDGVQVLRAWCLSARGEHAAAQELITPHVEETARADHDISFWLASFYAMEGLTDRAVDWVAHAIKLGNENYPLFADNHRLDNLRSDSRFITLMEGLRERWETRQ
jgi:eukaryotic-like serine/threonine-protein kinase